MSIMGAYDKDGNYTLSVDEFNIVIDFACYLVSADEAVQIEMIRNLNNKLTHECNVTGRSRDVVNDLFERLLEMWNAPDDPTLFEEFCD